MQTNQNIILTVHMSILLQLGKATRVRTNHTMVRRKGTLRQVMVHKTLHRTWTIQKLSSRPARQLMCSWRVKSPFYFYFYFYFYQNADCPFLLPLGYSLTFICPVSCVPYVASFSGLSFYITPSVFSNIYFSCVLCTLCCQFLWIVLFYYPLGIL